MNKTDDRRSFSKPVVRALIRRIVLGAGALFPLNVEKIEVVLSKTKIPIGM